MNSTETVLADIAKRVGGAGLTSGQTLGLAATMYELNITAQQHSTAVVKILRHMASTPENFATVTGKSVAEFQQLVATNIYDALKLVIASSVDGPTKLASTLDALRLHGAGMPEVFAKMGSLPKYE